MMVPMIFMQPVLPYPYAATEPFIDARTNTIHFTKHMAAFYTALNNAASTNSSLAVCSHCFFPKQQKHFMSPSLTSAAICCNLKAIPVSKFFRLCSVRI